VLTDVDLKSTSNGGFVQSLSGFDIRPFSDVGLTTALTFELVSYAPTTGVLEMHIKLSTLSHTIDTVIYLAYGNASLTTDGSASATWDVGFVEVQHGGDGTTISVADSTTLNPGTNHGATAAAGQVGGALSFNGSTWVSVADSNSLDLTTALTLSSWVKPTNLTQSFGYILSKLVSSNSNNIYSIIWELTNNTIEFYSAASPSFGFPGTASRALLADTNWHHIVYTYDGTTWVRYLDGVAAGTTTATENLSAQTGNLFFGSYDGTQQYFNGLLDEIRISNIARSASWVTAEYNYQKSAATFVTWGANTQLGSADGSSLDADQAHAGTVVNANVSAYHASVGGMGGMMQRWVRV
jgi:hypothetical protein